MVQDRRVHARVSAALNAEVFTGPGAPRTCPVLDLSRGGLFLSSPIAPAEVGQTVRLGLSMTYGTDPILVEAQVSRLVMASATGGGLLGAGMRFGELAPSQLMGLKDLLLEALTGLGGQRRAYPRVSLRREVRCKGAQELRATLRDVGPGGLSLETDRPPRVDQNLTVALDREDLPALALCGHVVSVEPLDGPRAGLQRVGIRFGPVSPADREQLYAFLKRFFR